MTKKARYFGKVCTQHPEVAGERYSCNGRCVKCTLGLANKRKTRNKYWVINYLSTRGCEACGISDPRVLSFDHIDPADKLFEISAGIRQGATMKSLVEEVAKCRVLCHNCHAIVSLEQQDSYHGKLQILSPEEFKSEFGYDY